MTTVHNTELNLYLRLLSHRWHVAGKSECSAKCGPGYRSLDVQCMKYVLMKRQSERMEASACGDTAKPQTREPCHGDCLLKSWQYSAWSQVWYNCILYAGLTEYNLKGNQSGNVQ